ncbi:MAG: helix-turn-helix domain-containing protein [Oscillospiraceae bacterium]|jgi:transcriptional regulator with XRE-family HTH domain|nr:helix-turn-helix domain-containing protein [Oscillospiraceae bacterium]
MNIEVANRLVLLRKQSGFSQEDLAERLGVSRQAVSKWERAESSPDTDNLIRLAKLYGVSLDNLLSMSEELPPPEPAAAPQLPNLPQDIVSEEPASQNAYRENAYNEYTPPENVIPVLKLLDVTVPLIIAGTYLFWGFALGWWSPTWLLFLLIPLYYTMSDAIKHGKSIGRGFLEGAFPLLVVTAYLLLGFFAGAWHPGWLIFLLIPLYYAIMTAVVKDR